MGWNEWMDCLFGKTFEHVITEKDLLKRKTNRYNSIGKCKDIRGNYWNISWDMITEYKPNYKPKEKIIRKI